jgi:purine-binding chemotaxis protein CheW
MNKTEEQTISSSTSEDRYVVFQLDEHFFALPVGIVERIVRVVNITPVPGSPDHILGVINVQGQPVPVFSMRKIFGLPAREMRLSDQLILVRTLKQTVSFVADMVTGVVSRNGRNKVSSGQIFTGLEKIVEGLVFCDDGIILIYDPEKLFTLENMEKLDLTVLEQKMKIIQETGEKERKKIPGQDNTAVNGEVVKTQTGKILKKTDKRKKDASKRLKTAGTKKINEKQKPS